MASSSPMSRERGFACHLSWRQSFFFAAAGGGGAAVPEVSGPLLLACWRVVDSFGWLGSKETTTNLVQLVSQPTNSIFLSHQISISHQPPLNQYYFFLTTNQYLPPVTASRTKRMSILSTCIAITNKIGFFDKIVGEAVYLMEFLR